MTSSFDPATKRIENHCPRMIYLPPTDTFPAGVKLIPGLNTVPILYLQELEAVEAVTETRQYKKGPVRYPGKEELARLQQHVKIVSVDGIKRGPQITVHTEHFPERDDGPEMPFTLDGFQEGQAKTLIERIKGRNAHKTLQTWAENTTDKKLRAMCKKRLAGLESSDEG